MFDRENNIDIVFRNGLKDMEVLPPADVWEGIPPVKARGRYGILLSMAAGIAALLTLSLFSSLFSKLNNTPSARTMLASIAGENNTIVRPSLLESVKKMQVYPADVFSEVAMNENIRSSEVLEIENNSSASLPSLAMEKKTPVAKAPEEKAEAIEIKSSPFTDIFLNKKENDRLVMTHRAKTEGQRFLLGASLVPGYGICSPGDDIRLAELMSREENIISYSTGITFAYKISSRLSFQSGIGVASIGQNLSGIDVYAGLSSYLAAKGDYGYRIETGSGTIISNNADLYLTDGSSRVVTFVSQGTPEPSKYQLDYVDSDIKQVFRYLEVPLLLRYKAIDRKVDLNISGGLAYGLLISNSAYVQDGSKSLSVGYTEGVNVHNLSTQLGLGMEYALSKQVAFNVEPFFRYYMTPFSETTGTVSRPFSFGVFSGVSFRF